MKDTTLSIFSERLRELRQEKGLTQKEFAESISITASALSAYENNSVNPSLLIVKKIAEKYNVSIDWLCGIDVNKNASIKTLSDLIRELLIIDFSNVFSVNYSRTPRNSDGTVKTDETVELSHTAIYDDFKNPSKESKDFFTFFKDWIKMRELYFSKSIDEEVYSLWIEKTLTKYESVALPTGDLPF